MPSASTSTVRYRSRGSSECLTRSPNFSRWRALAGAPVIHVAHRGRAGGMFDADYGGAIIERVRHVAGEATAFKTVPNASPKPTFSPTSSGSTVPRSCSVAS